MRATPFLAPVPLALALCLAAAGLVRAQNAVLLGEVLRPETRLNLGIAFQDLIINEGTAGEQTTRTTGGSALGVLDLRLLRFGALAQDREIFSKSATQTSESHDSGAAAAAALTLRWFAYAYSQEGEQGGFKVVDAVLPVELEYAYGRTGASHSVFFTVSVLRLGYSLSQETLRFRFRNDANPTSRETYRYTAVSQDAGLLLPFRALTLSLSVNLTRTPLVHGASIDYERRERYLAFELSTARARLRLSETSSEVRFTDAVTVQQLVRGADLAIAFTARTSFSLGYSHSDEQRAFVVPNVEEHLKLTAYTLGVELRY
ncbi:MAG: hypothetical protein HY423_02980 [Candidatus Lambdaproteobacteria bacterium]|nr:hypothetical protein [Candidatus Lambdaproteobacteria bacterium]